MWIHVNIYYTKKKNNQKPSVLNCLGPANNGRQLENFVEEVFPKRDAVDVPLHSQVVCAFVLSCLYCHVFLFITRRSVIKSCLYCHVFLFITDREAIYRSDRLIQNASIVTCSTHVWSKSFPSHAHSVKVPLRSQLLCALFSVSLFIIQ